MTVESRTAGAQAAQMLSIATLLRARSARLRAERLRFWLPVLALAALGCLIIADTYSVFSHTWDEPAHIAGGMELLSKGTYDHEPLHPPFGRTMTALLPYLDGHRHPGDADMWDAGNRILYDQGDYWRTLTLARLGVLPFFVLAVLLSGLWARQIAGWAGGVAAAALATATPAMLAHGGLAITDMTMTALYLAAVLAFLRWLGKGTLGNALLMGALAGLAVMSKYSAIPYLAGAYAAILLLRWRLAGISPISFLRARRERLRFEYALVMAVAVMWATHGFQFGQVDLAQRFRDTPAGTARTAEKPVRPVTVTVPLFMKSVPNGLAAVAAYNAHGKETFFLGKWRDKGHLLFFPVTLGVKLPIPLLILGLGGLILLARRGWAARDWRMLAPVAAFAWILGLGMLSNLNYGLRHVLPLVPLMCIAGGAGLVLAWRTARGELTRARLATAGALLLVWQGVAVARAHPDHLAYFNPLAADDPEKVLILGDLDWGQDMHRLSFKLRELGVDRFHFLYMGTTRPQAHGLPSFDALDLNGPPVTGWIVTHPRIAALYPDELAWLTAHESVAQVGRTFRIYRIEEKDVSG